MSKLSDLSMQYVVSRRVVADTLAFIRAKGAKREEGVVLWLARVDGDICRIEEAFVPAQETSMYRFDIPDREVFRILDYIADRGLVIPAQVHSHPGVECHSYADEAGALVQHEGGISVVVPYFGDIDERVLLDEIFTYRLSTDGEWVECRAADFLRIEP